MDISPSFRNKPFSWDRVSIDQYKCLRRAEKILSLDRKWLERKKEKWQLDANIDVVKRAVERLKECGYPFVKSQRERAIRFAAARGESEIVNLWLYSGKIDAISRGFSTIDAAEFGHLEIVRSLLRSGAISVPNTIEAASKAAKGDHLEIVRLLLGFLDNADLIPFTNRADLVDFAAKAGASDLLDFLLLGQNDGIIQDLRDRAVIAAATAEKPKIVSYILEKKGPISNFARGSAIESAAYHGDRKLVNLLFDSGPISDMSRHYAIQKALDRGYQEIANQLTPLDLFFAAEWGYPEVVQDLLTTRSIPKEEGIVAAKKAAEGWNESHLKVLRLILLQGEFSSLDIEDYDRGPILVFAARWGDEDLVQFLLSSKFIPYPFMDHAISAAEEEKHTELAEKMRCSNP